MSDSRASGNRIPALDGWRGIAIILVLLDHAQSGLWGTYLRPWTVVGQHGVTLFFVLSGYLITNTLLHQSSLRNFYIRRFFRLIPAAWAYLLFLIIPPYFLGMRLLHAGDLAACVFSYRNYSYPGMLLTWHFWSLSIEEQFYVVWPAMLLLLGLRKSRWLLVATALACAAWRLTHWSFYNQLGPNFRTEVRVDAICVGCLAALLAHDFEKEKLQKLLRDLRIPCLVMFAASICLYTWLTPLTECIALACLVSDAAINADSALARSVSFKPLCWVGTVSYSLYLWQGFFLQRGKISFLFLAAIPLFALASYYWIELPFTVLGRRLTSSARRREAMPGSPVAAAPAASQGAD